MSRERFAPGLSPSCDQIPCNATCKAVADLFLDFFQLLEDYSPVWYPEELRNGALAARSVLKKARPFSWNDSGNRASQFPS